MSEAEYRELQRVCEHDTRASALIELFLQTGLRLSEVASVRLCDLDLPASDNVQPLGAILVHGKGRKERTITLNSRAYKSLQQWLTIRPAATTDQLFVDKHGKPLAGRGIQRIVTHYLRNAGILNASTHTLRHTFATHSARKGTKLPVLQHALGHASLETTSIYVEMAREQMDKELEENAL